MTDINKAHERNREVDIVLINSLLGPENEEDTVSLPDCVRFVYYMWVICLINDGFLS